jgi:hypothetical protein
MRMTHQIGFTRHCFLCKKNKNAAGGKTDKRTSMWKCKDCLKFTWIKGNPPSVGWWPTKRESDVKENFNWSGTYRWWNGEYWSFPAFEHENSQKAASWASKLDKSTHRVMMWSHWPKESKC